MRRSRKLSRYARSVAATVMLAAEIRWWPIITGTGETTTTACSERDPEVIGVIVSAIEAILYQFVDTEVAAVDHDTGHCCW